MSAIEFNKVFTWYLNMNFLEFASVHKDVFASVEMHIFVLSRV
jgi:hypothetical protein